MVEKSIGVGGERESENKPLSLFQRSKVWGEMIEGKGEFQGKDIEKFVH